jgi:hypothetical protein
MATQSVRLTAPETGYLWAGYLVDHMSSCLLVRFHSQAKDQEIKELLHAAMSFGQAQLEKRRELMKEEGIPLPAGFSFEEDIHMAVPPVFSDKIYGSYLLTASRLGLVFHANALAHAIREDLREFAAESLHGTGRLYNRVMALLLEKGEYLRPPVVTSQDQAEFIRKPSFLNGFLGDRRPLTGIEIAGIYSSMELGLLVSVLNTAFAQVTKDPEVKEQFLKAKEMAEGHVKSLSHMLQQDELHGPVSFLSEIGGSTEAPFSDRLMLCHAAGLNSSLIEAYGYVLGYSMRNDLAMLYMKQIGQAGVTAESMSKLLMEREWLEKPPGALERVEVR